MINHKIAAVAGVAMILGSVACTAETSGVAEENIGTSAAALTDAEISPLRASGAGTMFQAIRDGFQMCATKATVMAAVATIPDVNKRRWIEFVNSQMTAAQSDSYRTLLASLGKNPAAGCAANANVAQAITMLNSAVTGTGATTPYKATNSTDLRTLSLGAEIYPTVWHQTTVVTPHPAFYAGSVYASVYSLWQYFYNAGVASEFTVLTSVATCASLGANFGSSYTYCTKYRVAYDPIGRGENIAQPTYDASTASWRTVSGSYPVATRVGGTYYTDSATSGPCMKVPLLSSSQGNEGEFDDFGDPVPGTWDLRWDKVGATAIGTAQADRRCL